MRLYEDVFAYAHVNMYIFDICIYATYIRVQPPGHMLPPLKDDLNAARLVSCDACMSSDETKINLVVGCLVPDSAHRRTHTRIDVLLWGHLLPAPRPGTNTESAKLEHSHQQQRNHPTTHFGPIYNVSGKYPTHAHVEWNGKDFRLKLMGHITRGIGFPPALRQTRSGDRPETHTTFAYIPFISHRFVDKRESRTRCRLPSNGTADAVTLACLTKYR